MISKILYLIVPLSFSIIINCSNQENENNYLNFKSIKNNPKIESQVDSLILPLVNEGLLSGNILIAKSGKITFVKSYGLADGENNRSNTPETIFRIGSITKPITAIAITQLHEKNLLDINDPLNKYLYDFPNGDKITLYQLLTHTSGLPSYDWTKSENQPQELDVVINWIKELDLKSEPDAEFRYSNSGYALLAHIIEMVSGMKYEEFLEKNIFIPCGMKNSGLYSMNSPLENIAFGYSRINYNGFEKANRPCPLARGDGDLYSTILDLYRLCINVRNNALLSSESWNKMFTPFKNSYGLGWYIEQLHGEEVIYHPGGLLGYMGNMRIFNDGDIIVINLFNNDFLLTHLVENQLAAIALGKPWRPLFKGRRDPTILNSFNAFVGEYPIDESTSFTLSIENGDIYFQESGGAKCITYPYSKNSIYIKEANYRIRFEKSKGEAPKYTGFFGLFMVTGQRKHEY